MKHSMRSKITDYNPLKDKPKLAPVMGRVRKDVLDEARPIIKKLNWSWGDFIEASLKKLIDDEIKNGKKSV
jgi:hypothetical protein